MVEKDSLEAVPVDSLVIKADPTVRCTIGSKASLPGKVPTLQERIQNQLYGRRIVSRFHL